ncbi:MAG: radical SAM protein [Nanoarchaeota archaeon]
MPFYNLKDKTQKYRIIAGILEKKPITGPYSVHLDLTNHCNNDCISCWSFSPLVGFETMDKETRKKQLPYKLVKRLIDDLADMNTREIYFTGGGEPFMHPNAIDIMEYVKKKCMNVDMSNNMTLITKEKAQRIVKAKIDHMNCSIWAGSPKAYARTHPNQTKRMFYKIEKTLKYIHFLKKKYRTDKPKLTLYHVISTENYYDFDNMVELAFKVKADAVEFTPTDIVPGMTDVLMLNKEQREGLADKVRNIWPKITVWEKQYNHKIVFKQPEQFLRRLEGKTEKGLYDENIIGKIPCYAGFNFLRILATGEVNSCLKSGRIPIGNIYEKSIKEIWMNSNQCTFRKHTIDYDVKDPYFNNIGNTTQKGNGCLYCCDNLGWNLIFHREIEKMNPIQKKLVKISKLL